MPDVFAPPPINRLPPGLLSLLGIKSGGRNPDVLNQMVTGCIDVWRLYLASAEKTISDGIAPAAAGFAGFPLIVVGQDEYWWVTEYGVRSAVMAAGQTCKIAITATIRGTITMLSDVGQQAAVGEFNLGTLARTPLLLPPGSSLGMLVAQQAAGPITYNACVHYTPLPN